MDLVKQWPKDTWFQKRRAEIERESFEEFARAVGLLKGASLGVDHTCRYQANGSPCLRCAIDEFLEKYEEVQ